LPTGDPGDLVDQAHEVGSLWMQQVIDVEQARRAVDRRTDILVAQGGEAGGHSGFALSALSLSKGFALRRAQRPFKPC
jgi:NAD(P)H-dependent flavin oxidoreductase YrpB (nitropropane dioxygenase family)